MVAETHRHLLPLTAHPVTPLPHCQRTFSVLRSSDQRTPLYPITLASLRLSNVFVTFQCFSAFALTYCYTLTHYSIIISVIAVEFFLVALFLRCGFLLPSKPGTSWFFRPPRVWPRVSRDNWSSLLVRSAFV